MGSNSKRKITTSIEKKDIDMKKILFFGEPLIRITPVDYGKLGDNVMATLNYGGSEVNVAKALQGFGIETKILTGLPNDALGDGLIEYLNMFNIDTRNIFRVGNRIGLYYLEEGYGLKNNNIYYDRKNTSINDIQLEQIDVNSLFENITHFHFSGITASISQQVRVILEFLIMEAKKRNIVISMDLNLRRKMISIKDAKIKFSEFVEDVDYCFGIEPLLTYDEDFEMFNKENATVYDIKRRMEILKEKFKLKGIFHTDRKIDINQLNSYKAYCLIDDFYESKLLTTPILDRVGSGDAFVAGALYGLINEMNPNDTINLGVASATYKCCIRGDNMYEKIFDVKALLDSQEYLIR
ncbi:sugar kinase [Clostridium sp. DSM 100503]|uniref:sugar kinase n=1 Tax=Clostridium sp. DSM 100503 TaxID=2963282 RepID=UPI00214A75E9|nr:sugar kinase [Clostridium sp. DSM 100503]MCR1950332.1 sugar kinase [Clostridium sp. DSM 100503]